MARRLGKNSRAKKYAELRQMQATANRFMKLARTRLGKEHGRYKSALTRIKNFYKVRGIKYRGYLSMYDLTRDDLKAYEQLMKSVIENSYINPHKQADMERRTHQTFIEEGGREQDYEQYRENYRLIDESDILQMLKLIGFKPSELNDYIQDFDAEGLTFNDFEKMCMEFLREYESGSYTERDFLKFADEWINAQYNEQLEDLGGE